MLRMFHKATFQKYLLVHGGLELLGGKVALDWA